MRHEYFGGVRSPGNALERRLENGVIGMKTTILALLAVAAPALAQTDAPSRGLVYNVKEHSSITYDCSTRADGLLGCDFVQTSVRKEAKLEELSEFLAQSKKQYVDGARFTADECKQMETLVDAVEGRIRVPKPDALANMPSLQRKDLVAMGRTAQAFCKAPSEANFMAFRRFEFEKRTRTCAVANTSFKQTFRTAPDSNGKVWLVQDSPSGPCGAVQAGRFEADEQMVGGKQIRLWKYYARRVITNPSGTFFGSMTCSGFDQREYEYDWKSEERAVGCDYVKFSPL